MNYGWEMSPGRDVTSLFMEFRDKPSEAPALLIVATAIVSYRVIVKSNSKIIQEA